MTDRVNDLRARLRAAQDELESEIDASRAAIRYRVAGARVIFEKEVRDAHRAAPERRGEFLGRTRLMVVLTAPLIYALIIPLVLRDLFVTIYMAVCFPIYGIAKVRRRDHLAIDRHHLQYLNGLQKLNCVYCGDGNGLLSYAREIASRTEAYWCPIKHAHRVADPQTGWRALPTTAMRRDFRERRIGKGRGCGSHPGRRGADVFRAAPRHPPCVVSACLSTRG